MKLHFVLELHGGMAMIRSLLLTLVAAMMTANIACKKENSIAPVSSDYSGRIVFNPMGENGENRGIFMLDMNSTALPLTKLAAQGIEPVVNSSGMEIVFTGWGPGVINIFRMNISGGNAINLTPDPSVADSWADWSPDGSSIVFNRVLYSATVKEALVVMNRDGSSLHLLTDTASLQTAIMPRWSPDGSSIAFVGRVSANLSDIYSLYTIAPDGSSQVILDQIGPTQPDSHLIWSPDAHKIAYERTNYDSTGGLYVIDVKSKFSQKIDFFGVKCTGQGSSWLSDGRLICNRRNPTDASWEIYLVSISSSVDGKLIAKNIKAIPVTTSSPDARYIAVFGILENDTAFELYVVGSDGSNFHKLKDIDASPGAFIDDWSYCQWVN